MKASISFALVLALAATARADEHIECDDPCDEPTADAADVSTGDPEDEPADEPKPARKSSRRWSIAVGPSVWAASVETTIMLGPVKVHREMPFAQIMQYMDGGMSGALDARFDRFTATGSFQYGRLAASTTKEVGSGMADLSGSITSVLVEGALGYEVVGGRESRFALELRSGFRYSQLEIGGMGTLGIAGTTVSARGGIHREGTDYLLGARGRVRLHRRIALTATGDTRVAGDSYSTWSIAGDVNVRAARWLTVIAGWRVLETRSDPTIIRRSGPQLVALFGF